MNEELRPCPFCGREVHVCEIKLNNPDLFMAEVGCEFCGVHFRKCRGTLEEAKSRAIEAWNARREKMVWHYPSKGDYPPVGKWEACSHLVLVFWWRVDSTGKRAKVYGLDRWCEDHKEWESYGEPAAWLPLPEPPEEEDYAKCH